jgi:TM2 domain-containing membrane protein YozV
MDCVNHSGVTATAYCQSCGKALCEACVRKGSGGQIFCEPCWMLWSSAATSQRPYVPPTAGEPSPALAAVLGFIPGVGAMYNGQFIKGMVHLVVFAVLVSAAHVYEVFGLFVMGWIFYQVFEAYQTAKARRDGDPLPDPLGLNELSNSIGGGMRPPPGPSQSPQQSSQQGPPQGPPPGAGAGATGAYQAPYQSSYQSPYQGPYQGPKYQGPDMPPIPPIPPIPPFPPMRWRRREPVGAVILIALGVLFLLGQFDWFSWHWFHFSWPLLLIGLGVWQIVRRLEYSRGMPPGNLPNNPQNGPHGNSQAGPQDHSQGGQQ